MAHSNKQTGFTIVEILIVVTIIGILAAIVIVAYVNITGQARDKAYITNAKSIQEAVRTVEIKTSAYPVGIGSSSGSNAFTTTSDPVSLTDGLTVTAAIKSGGALMTATEIQDSHKDKKIPVEFCDHGTDENSGTGKGIRIYYTEGSTIRFLQDGDCSGTPTH